MVLAAHRPYNTASEAKILALMAAVVLHLLVLWWFVRIHPTLPAAQDSALRWVETSSVPLPIPTKISPKPHRAEGSANVARTRTPSAASRNPVDEGSLAVAAGSTGAGADGAQTGSISGSRDTASRPVFHPPRVVRRARMEYPNDAFAAHQEGEAEVLVTIAADGTLIDAQISKSSGYALLDAATLNTIRQYVFEAGTKGGTPVEAQAYISLNWAIASALVFDNRSERPQGKRDRGAIELKGWYNQH